MRKKKLGLCFIGILVLLTALSTVAGAEEDGKGFYYGFDLGRASLNNDQYIYSTEGNERQPEVNVTESNQWDGPAYSIYAGYNFISKEIDLLGEKPTLKLGVQGGYTELGEYTINVKWSSVPGMEQNETGYRRIEEKSVDLLLTSTLLFENGFNLSFKGGIAQLNGSYKQENLPSHRNPSVTFNGEADYVVYRPELALGVGYLFNKRFNLYLQYNTIFGDTPEISTERFAETGRVEMPNTLYKVDRLTLGVMYLF